MNNWICREKRIKGTKNKYYCLQIGNYGKHYNRLGIELNISTSHKSDHAGFYFEFALFKLYFIFNIYDNRHWCNECNKFMNDECYDKKHDE